jgi:3-oxoacyl-[acyl-carrier protein] reductase
MEKKIIFIAGGSGGIGSGLLRGLVSTQNKIYFTYNANSEKANEIENEYGPEMVKGYKCDVKEMSQVREVVERVLQQENDRIDVLINAFGITRDKPFVMMQDEDWHQVIDINLNGVYNTTRSIIFSMMKRKSGNIINLSSVSGLHGLPGQTNYSATKAAIIGFSKSLAKEVAQKGIRVNVLAPGFIESSMTAALPEKYLEAMVKNIPLGRIGNVNDLIGLTKYLISEESSYITGQVFPIDGGMFI